jgi:uncharacterized membrane protein required for colicin V production
MNWSDLVVIGVILGFAIIGMTNGFIYSMFKIASFFISLYVSFKFYPVVADFLMKTALYTNIKASILKNLLMQQTSKIDGQAKNAAADSIINNLHLPGFLKDTLISKFPNPSQLIDIKSIMDKISGELASVVISVISMVLLYIIIRIGLVFVRFILQGLAKLPIFKQVDKLGGFAFGGVEGLLTVYILCAVLMLFNASAQFKPVFQAVDSSVIAKWFYQHNFIVDWMFSKGKPI